MKSTNRKEKGFSLIELLVVVAIILIITAIAIPSLLRARVRGQDTHAVASVRGWANGINTYLADWSTFPLTAANLGGGELAASAVPTCAVGQEIPTGLAAVLGAGMTANGYTFTYQAAGALAGRNGCAGAATWDLTGVPVGGSSSNGNDAVCQDATGLYHTNSPVGTPATGISCKTDGYAVDINQ
jgi:type IV pilus assembly protein PilA